MNVRVLLIPLSLGADGLSVIEATHVFLVEPLISRATEMQAIARVSRIGQTKQTHVHKYVLAATIEEKIHTAQNCNEAIIENAIDKSNKRSPGKGRATERNVLSVELLRELFNK
jgi:E3 ubiquitin-protein ligase SHPRH